MEMSDKVQIGIGAAALVVGMQLVQNGKSAAKSFSAYQHVRDGTESLIKCRSIIESEAGKAITADQRKGFVDKFLQLEFCRDALEQEYNNLYSCLFNRSGGQAFSKKTAMLHSDLLKASHIALAYKMLEQAEKELAASRTPAPLPARGTQNV